LRRTGFFTNNAKDFLRLAGQKGFHPGLVFLSLGSQQEMCEWMTIAIAEVERLAAKAKASPATLMVNSVIEVDERGGCAYFEHP
jgi:hypothetical protein